MKFIFILTILVNSALVFGQAAEFSFHDKTTVKWDKTTEGEVLKHYFVFTNTGTEPLIISEAKVACSCTKVSYPRYPIPPKGRDSVLVSFDTQSKSYYQDRTIELIANTKKSQKLRLKVYVIPKED